MFHPPDPRTCPGCAELDRGGEPRRGWVRHGEGYHAWRPAPPSPTPPAEAAPQRAAVGTAILAGPGLRREDLRRAGRR